MRIAKIIFFNILGLIVGIFAGHIVLLLTSWLLVDVLGNFKFLTAILSWPVDYDTYAFTGIIAAVAYASVYACAALCRFGKGSFHFSCVLVGLYEIIIYMISFIQTIIEHGFSFDILWMIFVTLGTFALATLSAATGEEP